MRTLLFLLLLLTAIGVQAQVYETRLLSDHDGALTQDTLDMTDTTVTTKYLTKNPLIGVWITLKSLLPDTVRVYARPKYPRAVYDGPVPDSSDMKMMVYQPERIAGADSLVILQPMIGSAYYQARFRLYEPVITEPFYLKVAVKKDAIMYIKLVAKD